MTTNTSLTDELMGQLQGTPMQGLAQQLGIDSAQAEQAVGVALPMLFGALGQNASQPQGASDLLGALQRDHSSASGAMDLGGLLGGLGGLLGGAGGGAGGGLGSILGSVLGGNGAGANAAQADGGSILGHIFGGNQDQAQAQLGQATGLGGNSGQLLAMLAPLVMSFLANRVHSQGMGAGELGNALGQENSQIQAQGGPAGGILGSLLDQNGDGKLDVGDLFKLGGSLLGGRR
ncbi:calcium-binding protein [Comamonas phosphati]|nr:calcium-binding protein [Comamonas phosphati]